MKIGIIGSGMIGETSARLFVKAGHEVAISNSRGPESLKDLVRELGPKARAMSVEDAAAFGEVVLVAVPLKAYDSLPRAQLSGKIVIDAMNYYPQRDGQLDFKGGASTEFVAQHLPGARVVKALNTMYFKPLGEEGKPGAPLEDRWVLFVAGDDAAAKQTVSGLIEQIGFTPVDTGTLATGGKRQQPGTALYNRLMRPSEAREALSTL
ncbi:NADPH-dependent F420 reductase [Archangium violaceum]|uniref:NADPH-dependent F420 reductase n=1 Tax=Archangium violaceum TaxID=83451 RepID=UPI00193B411E|nr:NADPH-dependent F420 reductase [Archangium violaceum]QRK07356.1 NADPH-dependent F420 reductase [Archangium violaceum]